MINAMPMADLSPATRVEFPTDEIRKQGVYGEITREEDGELDFADSDKGRKFREKLTRVFPGLDLRQGLIAAAGQIGPETPPSRYSGKVWQYCGYAFNNMKEAESKQKNYNSKNYNEGGRAKRGSVMD